MNVIVVQVLANGGPPAQARGRALQRELSRVGCRSEPLSLERHRESEGGVLVVEMILI